MMRGGRQLVAVPGVLVVSAGLIHAKNATGVASRRQAASAHRLRAGDPALKSLLEERSAQEQEEGDDEVKTITPPRAKSRFLAHHPPDWEHCGH
jgi:hypothetical protein